MTTAAQLEARVQALAALPPPKARRALREAAGISLAEIGAAVGVTSEAVRLWELGRSRPHGEHLHAYLELLAMFKRTVGA